MPVSHGEDEDPYAPRSTSEYYSSASAGSSSSNGGARAGSRTPTEGARASARAGASRPRPSRSSPSARVEETPLFGGEPFRDSHRTTTAAGGTGRQTRSRPLDDYDEANGDARGAQSESGPLEDAGEDAGEEAQTDGFYALLNVQQDASEDEIRDAYRALAVVLHPDKHTSPQLKAAAEARFRAVQRAYEVLSDAERRSVYDHFGEAGLAHSWSVAAPTRRGGPRSAQEMRDEWERAARTKRDEDLENLVRSKGEFTISVDANSLFCDQSRVPRGSEVMKMIRGEVERMKKEGTLPEDGKLSIVVPPVSWSERISRVGVTQLIGKHGWETPITTTTRASLQGQMVSRGGSGGGNLIGTLKTQWNHKFSTEISTTMMRPRLLIVKGQYEVTEFSFVNFVATATSPVVPPALNLTFAQRLSTKSPLTGFTTFKAGSYSIGPWGKGSLRAETPTIGVGCSSQSGEGKGWTITALVGADNLGLTMDYALRPAFLGAAKVRLGGSVGTGTGFSAHTNLERRVTENVRLGIGLSCGLPSGGVTLRFKANRLGQRLTVPLQLSPEFRSDLAVACAILPLISLTALEHLYLKPAKRRRIAAKLAKLRTDNVELIEERRRAALEARMVLVQGAKKKAEAERRRGGLVIIEAFYGKKESVPSRDDMAADEADMFRSAWSTLQQEAQGEEEEETWDEKPLWDVKIPLMTLVSRGQLVIPGGRSKSKLLGFFDPCMGERKHLVVRYLFRGRLHEAVVDDVTQLACPLRAHQL